MNEKSQKPIVNNKKVIPLDELITILEIWRETGEEVLCKEPDNRETYLMLVLLKNSLDYLLAFKKCVNSMEIVRDTIVQLNLKHTEPTEKEQ